MKQIATALVKAQRAFGPALKTSANPYFKSKYADLSTCIEAVMTGLNDAGIALIQRNYLDSDGVTVETIFLHESGEILECGKLHVPAAKADPQGYGSALTYARRYSLMAACGIAPEDDDGNAASRPRREPEPAAKDEYLGYEGLHLPNLREAALEGGQALQEAFGRIPKTAYKMRMWELHSKSLKKAAEGVSSA